MEATWLVVTPPCSDVRLGQGLCRSRGQPLRGTQRNLLPQPPRPGKRPESWSFTWTGSLGGRRACLRNAGPSCLGGLWASVWGKLKCPSEKPERHTIACPSVLAGGIVAASFPVEMSSAALVLTRVLSPRSTVCFPSGAPQAALVVKNPPANAGGVRAGAQSLGREDPLQEGMATHPIVLAWRVPWTEEPGGLQSTGSQSVGHD